jgi:hypothetical protein
LFTVLTSLSELRAHHRRADQINGIRSGEIAVARFVSPSFLLRRSCRC